jgi:(p)ppGpp synthase/HD superfamily hydrolase
VATPLSASRFSEALVLANGLHAGQLKKGTRIPYVGHLLAVCAVVLDYGGDEDEAVAALLHDAVEKGGGLPALEAIREKFGGRVADTVLACSDSAGGEKPPWRERKAAYLAALPAMPLSALRVSTADKLCNARLLLKDFRRSGNAVWERFGAGKEGALWYYRALVAQSKEALWRHSDDTRAGEVREMVEELDRVVAELERLAA